MNTCPNCKKEINELNFDVTLWDFTKENKEFLEKYKIYSSVWNVGVLQNLNLVYLNENDLKRLQNERK